MPVDGAILQEKSLKISATVGIRNFSASNGWMSCFKQRHGLVFKQLARESAAVDKRLLELLGYEAWDVYSTDETGLFFHCLPDWMLALKKEACHGGKIAKE
jgi:hypothetical protein